MCVCVENFWDLFSWPFLVVHWLRICLPMQGTWVLSLVQEDCTCCRAARLVWPQLLSPCTLGSTLQQNKPPLWEAPAEQLEGSPCLPKPEKACTQQWRPSRAMKVAQSCPTFCSAMGYTIRGMLQARILEWVAFPFTRGSSQPRDWTQVSHIAGSFLFFFLTRWPTWEAQHNHK